MDCSATPRNPCILIAPAVRHLLRVQIEDAIEADKVFTMPMGDEVEPRRDFIESNKVRKITVSLRLVA